MKVSISVAGKFQAYDLARELNRRECLGQLITSLPKFTTKGYVPREKVDSVVLPEALIRAWRKLPSFMRNAYDPHARISAMYDGMASRALRKCDICVAWAGYGLETLRRAKKLGAKTVIERGSSHILYHTEILKEEAALQHSRVQFGHPKVIEKELREYEEADYISIPSLFVKRTFLDRGFPESKLIHVPYGVDLALFKEVRKEDGVFRVIFGGGICFRKGVHYLLQAFAELNLPNSELLLLGTVADEMIPYLKKYEGHFRQMAYRPKSELHWWYSQGSVFVMPSLEEGLAMVQPQAMACGLPVVATTNTGGDDIIRDGIDGYIIPIRDVEKLKEKILFLYK